MPLDYRIITQAAPPTNTAPQFFQMGRMARADQQAEEDRIAQKQAEALAKQDQMTIGSLIKGNTAQDGSINRRAVVAGAYNVNPQIGMQLEKQWGMGNAETEAKINELVAREKKSLADIMDAEDKLNRSKYNWLAGMMNGVNDQGSYDAVRQLSDTTGLSKDLKLQLPEQYDERFKNTVINQARTLEDQFKSAEAKRRMDIDQQQTNINKQNADTQRYSAETARSNVGGKAQEKQAGKEAKYEMAKIERTNIKTLIDDIKKDPAFATGLNIGRVGQILPGTSGYTFGQKVANLRNKLALNERAKLRGQGQISDKESEMLNKAVTILNTNLPKKDFLNELNNISAAIDNIDTVDRNELGVGGQSGGSQNQNTITSPSGNVYQF